MGMNRILILLASLLVVGNVYALPPCPWSDVLHNCFGSQTWDGGKYVGEYKDGLPHGQGTGTWVTQWEGGGIKYVGEWKNGKMHGHGIDTSIGVGKYVGEWRDGFQYGHGIYTFFDEDFGHQNGDVFIGEFLGNFMHGHGIYIHANGKETVGEWNHSEPWNTVGYDLSGRFRVNYKDGVPYLP